MKPQQEPSTTAADSKRARAEQVFFEDPALDRLMGVVFSLATEHFVLLDRVHALEGRLRALEPANSTESAEAPSDRADASAFAEAVLRPLLGLQQARGATGEFSLARAARQEEKSR